MRGELPGCKRCCICLPLRYSLITWGYIRLIMDIPFLLSISNHLYEVYRSGYFSNSGVMHIIYGTLIGTLLVLTLTDMLLNTVFIAGGHKKNLKLLRAYYIYSIVLCALTTLLELTIILYLLSLIQSWNDFVIITAICFFTRKMELGFCIIITFIQVYVILLVRSEIKKLGNNSQFRFVNNAAESECTMVSSEEEIACGEETENIESRYVPKDTCQSIGYVEQNDD